MCYAIKNNSDCIWYSDPESDSQRELKATYSVRCRPTWEINLYLTPGPWVEPGSYALKASKQAYSIKRHEETEKWNEMKDE